MELTLAQQFELHRMKSCELSRAQTLENLHKAKRILAVKEKLLADMQKGIKVIDTVLPIEKEFKLRLEIEESDQRSTSELFEDLIQTMERTMLVNNEYIACLKY